MRPRGIRHLIATALAASVVIAGCAGAAPATSSPSAVASPQPSAAASPAAEMLPTELVGTWAGTEEDANLGVTWQTTYRLETCRQHDKPWKKPADDQRCGEWTGDATVEGEPAHCEATLYWLEQEGAEYKFLATSPGGGKYRTIPHPYVKIDDEWYCWDTFRFALTPDASGSSAIETVGAGALAGSFAATSGTVTKAEGP